MKIFVSHSRKDREFANRLATALVESYPEFRTESDNPSIRSPRLIDETSRPLKFE